MKQLLWTMTIAGGLLALNLQAAPADKTDKKGGKRAEAKERGSKMADELSLTAEQKEKIKPILKAEREKMQDLKELPAAERRAKLPEIRKEVTEKLKPILTPEQLEKWQKLREQPQGKRGEKKARDRK
jgi:Spy/CpxP family protein refolding chaperone